GLKTEQTSHHGALPGSTGRSPTGSCSPARPSLSSGELEKIVADREAARQARLDESEAKKRRENAESAAAREELNAVLEGTGLYAPFGREAVHVLTIAKAYHEAQK